MTRGDIEGDYLTVQQGKTSKRLRIQMQADGVKNSLGLLIEEIMERNKQHSTPHFILNKQGLRVSWQMLRNRWDAARLLAAEKARKAGSEEMAQRIMEFQFRDIRPKAASKIADVGDASRLLGHSKEGITERVYRRVGAIAEPTK